MLFSPSQAKNAPRYGFPLGIVDVYKRQGQHGGNVLALQAGDVGGHHHRGLFAVSGETVAAVAAELCTGGKIYIKMIIGQRLAQVLTQLFCLPAAAGVADGRKGIQRFACQIACHRGGLAAVVEYA